MNNVFVFGISGATWRMIDPLLAAGELPAMRGLIDRGVRATLASVRVVGDKHFRPQIAWPTIATGVGPETHGVTRFFHRFDDVVVPTFWERFEKAGARVGLFGWPITWPVREVNGFLIPAYDGRDPSTWPQEYSFIRTLDRRQEAARGGRDAFAKLPFSESFSMLSKLIRGGVRARTFARLMGAAIDVRTRAPDELRPLLLRHARLEISTDIFLKLCRKHAPDFSAFITFLVDYASHRFWIFQEPDRFADAPKQIPSRLKNAVADAYRAVDRALARILQTLDSDTIVAVLSEHGMAAEEVSTEIGPWHYVLRPGKLKEFLDIDPAMPAAPVARWIAFRPPHEQIEEAADRFREVRIDGTDLPLFQIDVHRGEVIVKLALWRKDLERIAKPQSGQSTPPSPLGGLAVPNVHAHESVESLQVRFRDRVLPFTSIVQRFGRRRSAMHAEDGVLILAGPGIQLRALDRARLIDVAPTLLHAAGIDDSHGLDGAVLDVF